MKDFNLFDDSFTLIPEKKYHLSIQVNLSSFTFCILNIDEKRYVGMKHFNLFGSDENKVSKELENILKKETLLRHSFTSSSVMYSSFRTMLVPETLFDAQNLKTFLKFHYEVDERDRIYSYEVKNAEGFLVYTIPLHINNFFEVKLPNTKFYHHCIPFITNALKSSNSSEIQPKIYLNFDNDFFDVLIIRNGKILLFNSFFYKKYSDVLYFLTSILNLFSLKPDRVKLILSGNIGKEIEIEKEIVILFKNIEFQSYSEAFSYSYGFETSESHRFINLLNLYSCVS